MITQNVCVPAADYTRTPLPSLLPGFYHALAKSLDEAKLPAGALQFSRPALNHRDITLTLWLKQGAIAAKVLALGPAIETNANWPPGVTLERSGGFILARFHLPPELCRPLTLAELPREAVGLDSTRRPVRVTLDDSTRFALKIFGAPGAGKTTLGKLILLRLMQRHSPDGLQIIICDPKRKLGVFQPCAHVRHLAQEPEQIDAAITAWCAEIDRREALNSPLSRGGQGGVEPAGEILLYIEEASRSLQNPDTYARLVKTVKTCRDVGGRVIYINQTAGTDANHSELLRLITYAIVGKTASGYESARLSGQAGVSSQKLGHGGGSFKIDQDGAITEFLAAHLTDADLATANLPHSPAAKRPELIEGPIPAISSQLPNPPHSPNSSNSPTPRVQPTPADIATAIAYHRLYGKPISARVAARLNISRRRWERLTGPANDYEQITRLIGPITRGLQSLEKKGEL